MNRIVTKMNTNDTETESKTFQRRSVIEALVILKVPKCVSFVCTNPCFINIIGKVRFVSSVILFKSDSEVF